MHESIIKLQEQLPPVTRGTPKSIFLGLLSNTVTTIIIGDPTAAIVAGAATGSGFELVDRIIRRKEERTRVAAKNALTLHFTALLRSELAPPKINLHQEADWLDDFLKRRAKRKL